MPASSYFVRCFAMDSPAEALAAREVSAELEAVLHLLESFAHIMQGTITRWTQTL
ncbi:hypothetical protein [Nocardia amamiensis]|uniref:hypothetical protein n=1 Tax=Nocardia TaxID=1817 RepID=UPI0033DBB513